MILNEDGASNEIESGAWTFLISPEEKIFKYALKSSFEQNMRQY